MTVTKHTPGPWAYEQDNPPYGGCTVTGEGEYICTTSGRALANARLIAVAPDLLRELKSARATIVRLAAGIRRRDERQHVNAGASPDYTTQIDVVIAKAEGKP